MRTTRSLRDLASAFHLPVIATNGVRFAEPADRPLYDVLTCIRHKTTLEHAGPAADLERRALSEVRRRRWRGCSRDCREAIAGDRRAGRSARLHDGRSRLPLSRISGAAPARRWRRSCGRSRRPARASATGRTTIAPARQIERELDLIEKLDLAGYFLIVWDIVNYCRQHDILVQGRGSAANSAVCYSLGITAVDPIGMDLLFERFLSEERGEWPDIDLDLPSGDRRERVIQHIYEKYGSRGAATGRGSR